MEKSSTYPSSESRSSGCWFGSIPEAEPDRRSERRLHKDAAVTAALVGEQPDCLRRGLRRRNNRDNLTPPARKRSRCLRHRAPGTIQDSTAGAFVRRSNVFAAGVWRITEARQEHLELIRRMKEGLRVAAGKNAGLPFHSFRT